ncbi:MAG: MFS transporter, partial [Caulobacterales bacterium]
MTRRISDRSELWIYYLTIALYFFAFGLQFIIYPALVTFVLRAPPGQVGLAQTALSSPMFALLLIGGLLAERTRNGRTMAWLYGAMALATAALTYAVAAHALTYPLLLVYAVTVGSCAALVGPARDAALNGVLDRVRFAPSIATAAAVTTSVQIGAQIAGIITARSAGADPAPYLAAQAAALIAAAAVSLFLRAPKPAKRGGTLKTALADLKEGLNYAFKNPVMGPMLISSLYSGVFVIGSFQVLLPLIVREE